MCSTSLATCFLKRLNASASDCSVKPEEVSVPFEASVELTPVELMNVEFDASPVDDDRKLTPSSPVDESVTFSAAAPDDENRIEV